MRTSHKKPEQEKEMQTCSGWGWIGSDYPQGSHTLQPKGKTVRWMCKATEEPRALPSAQWAGPRESKEHGPLYVGERFRADVAAHVGQVEGGLSLGADPAVTVAPYVQSAVYASLIPRLDSLKSLGIVWVPGMMAGMIVSGANPIYAGIYLFIVMAMIFAAYSITALAITLLLRTRAFSPTEQLILRRGVTEKLGS